MKSIRLIILGLLLGAAFFIVSSHTVSGAESEKSNEPEQIKKEEKFVLPKESDFKNSKEYGIELEKKREALQDKYNEIADYEKKIKEQEKALDEKLKQLNEVRAAISGENSKKKADADEKVSKLVSVFETMTPKSTAAVFETLDDSLAVDVLKKMDIKKMSKVMNIMDKSRSARLSELMTDRKHDTSKQEDFRTAGQGGVASERAPAQVQPVKKEPATTAMPTDSNSKKGG